MSTAHRPTWDPAQAREVKGGSRQYSSRDMAAHTKLKFRQPGQTSSSEVAKRDLRAELLLAEHEAKNKKRKAQGLPPLPFEDVRAPAGAIEGTPSAEAEDESANKRRKLLQEALELDRDDDDDESDGEGAKKDGASANVGNKADGDGDTVMNEKGEKDSGSSDEDEEDDDDDDEDETAVLLRELEKIKRERAEEKARLEAAENASAAASREAEIAMGNPLLNLAAALGADTPNGINTTAPGTFAVKRRWDDDLIFKNQAASSKDKASGQFVNDLLRTEFHRKFMGKFIK